MLGMIARRLSRAVSARADRRRARDVAEVTRAAEGLGDMDPAAFLSLTARFRKRLASGEAQGAISAFATASAAEALWRGLGLRPFPVQVSGALALQSRKVALMATGEGKTLSVLMAAYAEALPGAGVHVVTANDYLARRDAASAAGVLGLLGMTVGCIVSGMADADRRAAYTADVTYVAGPEAGFDFLRDNMRMSPGETVQRPFHSAIVDEADSILVDEARTPLVISGEGPDRADAARLVHGAVASLRRSTWRADPSAGSVHLTDAGLVELEGSLRAAGAIPAGEDLHDGGNAWLAPMVHQSLRALHAYVRDRDYVVHGGKVVIVDHGTGRMMPDRRFSDGLHQAIEAKEGISVLPDNTALASITFQALFRLYPRLSGTTGTVAGIGDELAEVYDLEVVTIPTNAPVARVDSPDTVFGTAAARDTAVADAVRSSRDAGRPVLVGVPTVARSRAMSAALERAGIPHAVLNALNHGKEARIVAQAGRPGAVTVATDMAGRGTDIVLGGNAMSLVAESLPDLASGDEVADAVSRLAPQVAEAGRLVREAGGLLVIGTSRHESRRVDDQLRGRSGRQGDPGGSVFMTSLEDDIILRHGGDPARGLPAALAAQVPDDGPIPHGWAAAVIARAQGRAENQAAEARRSVFRFDRIVSLQRSAFYARRRTILLSDDPTPAMAAMRDAAVVEIVGRALPEKAFPEQWDVVGATMAIARLLGPVLPLAEWVARDGADAAGVSSAARDWFRDTEVAVRSAMPPGEWEGRARTALLSSLDRSWQHHLSEIDTLREGIGLRAAGQRDPLHEWNAETSASFELMSDHAASTALSALWHPVMAAFMHGVAPAFPARVPMELVEEGRADVVMAHLEHLENGDYA